MFGFEGRKVENEKRWLRSLAHKKWAQNDKQRKMKIGNGGITVCAAVVCGRGGRASEGSAGEVDAHGGLRLLDGREVAKTQGKRWRGIPFFLLRSRTEAVADY